MSAVAVSEIYENVAQDLAKLLQAVIDFAFSEDRREIEWKVR